MQKRGIMRLSGFPLLVASSLILIVASQAETRPKYGGTLRINTRISPVTLDPSDNSPPDSIARRNLTHLLFDTLVIMDDLGRLQPALATNWQAESGNQRWQFWLRKNVRFHDGSPLTPDAVAASLRAANPRWTVFAAADSVVIERDSPAQDLAPELARPRNAIAKRGAGNIIGTGPFHVTEWQPAKKLSLTAEEGYWGGRAFVDGIEIELGKSGRDQLIALELGRTDVTELAPEQSHRAGVEGGRAVTSAPVELMALVFTRGKPSPDESKLRDALELSIDRASIRSVVLQGAGEPTGGILPDWVSGYAFVFPAEQNLARARQERAEVRVAPAWTLAYDSTDPAARVIAERIALNARDAGLNLQTAGSSSPDLRLVRIPLPSLDPRIALATVASVIGVLVPKLTGSAAEDIYQAESAILQAKQLIPLFQLPACYALSPAVRDANPDRVGNLHLENTWLGGSAP